MPRKYVKRTRRPRKGAPRRAKRTGKGFVTKAQVARMIGRRIEDKCEFNTASNVDVPNKISQEPYFNDLNFQGISQGTGQGERIGNRCTIKSARLTGTINCKDYSTFSNSRQLDQLVTLVVFKLRNYTAGVNPTYANTFSKMFQLGSTSGPLTNTTLDHIRSFNKDIFMIKTIRKFKMGYSTNVPSGANGTGTQAVPSNDFKYQAFFKIPLTKYYKKTQMFNDNDTNVINDNLFFMVFTAPADNSAFTSTPLAMSWDVEWKYEDA